MTNTNIRTYSELIKLPTFKERLEYLKLDGSVGEETFGCDRFLNQAIYRSSRWRRLRNEIIVRDNGCDLAMDQFVIYGRVIIHHMNPLTIMDIQHGDEDAMFNPEYLITTTIDTHNMIHYGTTINLKNEPIERRPGDTCPWK